MKYYLSPPPMNPISRVLAAIMAVLMVTAAVFFGMALLLVLGAAFAILALIFYLRLRWLGRTGRIDRQEMKHSVPDGEIIDAEYTVVSRQQRSK